MQLLPCRLPLCCCWVWVPTHAIVVTYSIWLSGRTGHHERVLLWEMDIESGHFPFTGCTHHGKFCVDGWAISWTLNLSGCIQLASHIEFLGLGWSLNNFSLRLAYKLVKALFEIHMHLRWQPWKICACPNLLMPWAVIRIILIVSVIDSRPWTTSSIAYCCRLLNRCSHSSLREPRWEELMSSLI